MESLKNCMNLQEELRGLLFDGSNLENEDACLFDYISKLENPKDVLDHCKKFKDEGNSSFKEGDLDDALEKYELSMVFLSGLVLKEVDDRISFSQLATSVVLNMAASLLKKKEFRQVGHLCSVVLNHNPENVKALFRRANAAIGLGNYELACWDLRLAHEVESSNQEVGRKLREVEQILNSLPGNKHGQGKEKQEECGSVDPINDSMDKEGDSKQNERENINCNDIDHCKMMEVEKSDGRINVMGIDHAMGKSKTKDVEMSERANNNGVREKGSGSNLKVVKSKYHFHNRRKLESAVVISKRDYHLLAKGRTIQHFNFRLGIAMSIRVIGTPQETSKKISESLTQHHISHSPPRRQREHIHHKAIADSVTHDTAVQSERSILMEISPPGPEEVKMDQPTEATPMLQNCPPHATPLERSLTCFQSIATGNRSLSFQSITTGNRSLTRRTRNRVPEKGVTKDRRIKHRNPTCVLSNYGFQCRSKIEASIKHSDYLPPNSQNLSSYRSGVKRKSVFLQSPDLPQQPRKLLIIKNEICNSYSHSVCNLTL